MQGTSAIQHTSTAQRILAACTVIALVLSTVALTARPLDAQTALGWSQQGGDIDGQQEIGLSGFAVSISALGNRLAVASPLHDGPAGLNSGRVDIYEWDGLSWQHVQELLGENPYDFFGFSVSLSADGSRLAVGAIGNASNGPVSGYTQVFTYEGALWMQIGNDIVGEAAGDFSGASVSLSADGTLVAIGATDNGGNGIDSGHVRVFTLDGRTWDQVGSDINGEAAGDFSGDSVALSADGSRVAIGTPRNDGNGIDSGQARVYERIGDRWVQVGADIDGESAGDFSAFAISLSADGNRLAVGADGNDGNGGESGHVRVYDWNGNRWVQAGSDINGEASGDFFGRSVSLSSDGGRLAVGADGNDGNGVNSGHVRVYDWNGNRWVQVGPEINGEATNDFFGGSVSLSAYGARLAVGAPENDANAPESGYTRVFVETGGDPRSCLGSTVTVSIAHGDFASGQGDVILGTPGDDRIGAGAGPDKVCGLGGDDRIWGEDGTDIIQGGKGDDHIHGGMGPDTLFGNDGNDLVLGDLGHDTIHGNDGDDVLDGEADNDTIYGGAGNDEIRGGWGNDTISGNAGDDIMFGEGGADTLVGGQGRDTIDGGEGDDIIYGSKGGDTLNGDAGNDIIEGNDGFDVISGGDDDDQIYGNNGNDLIDGGAGDDNLVGGQDRDTISGGDGNDSIYGSKGGDTLNGDIGNDLLSGQKGFDTLDGGRGNDTLAGGDGNDSLTGYNGIDSCNGNDGTDSADATCETVSNIP